MLGKCPRHVAIEFLLKGRIRTRRHIHVQIPFLRRIHCSVTICIRSISAALRCGLFHARRTHKLPHCRILHPACRRQRRIRNRSTSRRWRTPIVKDPIRKFPWRFVRANIVGGPSPPPPTFTPPHPPTINPPPTPHSHN